MFKIKLTKKEKETIYNIFKLAHSWQDGDYQDDWVVASITVALK